MRNIIHKFLTYLGRINEEDIIGRIKFLIAYLTISVFRILINRKYFTNNNWLIGENAGHCLKDNGYYFYQFCKNERSERSVFFVIKKKSPYFAELCNEDRILQFGSFKHAFHYYIADVCFYTHSFRDLIYNPFYKIIGKNKSLIYLHHGLLGFKKLDFDAIKYRNSMDIFIVGNSIEKDILVNQIGTDEKKIKVTGYPRFDWVENTASSSAKQIIYIPTHRNPYNKLNVKNFLSKVNSLINNQEFNKFLHENNITLKVCLHQAIQSLTNKLNSKYNRIEIINFGQTSVTTLIKESHLMITDYSSVSWDFFFLGKSVIFYRFDILAYLQERSSYLPLDEEIIGEIAFDEVDLINKVKESFRNDFSLGDKFIKYKNDIFPSNDYKNCERVFNVVDNLSS